MLQIAINVMMTSRGKRLLRARVATWWVCSLCWRMGGLFYRAPLCALAIALSAAACTSQPPRISDHAQPRATSSAADSAVGASTSLTLSPTAGVFPLAAYDQNIDHWITPSAADANQALISQDRQQRAMNDLRNRDFGGAEDTLAGRSASPWNRAFITRQNSGDDRRAVLAGIEANIERYGPNGPLLGFGPNLLPYPARWMAAIKRNIDTDQWSAEAPYTALQRAITTANVSLRLLPTVAPHFYDPRLPGEGYPFDNLQETQLRPGTPLYVLGSTVDHGWLYVIAPDVSGWVKNDAIAWVDETFVRRWRAAAAHALGAVIAPALTVTDVQGVYRFDAPIGTVLPLVGAASTTGNAERVWIPVLTVERRAVMVQAPVRPDQVTRMPYIATPAHMAVLLKALQARPYGWGGAGDYNDCSLELKSLFTPFGMWLPRHSSAQVEGAAMVDLSAQSYQARIDYLTRYGKPYLTIIDIHGHVMLYLGERLFDGQRLPMVYEDLWGLTPPDASRRAIVGQSVVFPLLKSFPEDAGLQSQAARPVFRLGFPADQISVEDNDRNVGTLPPEEK